MRIGTRTGSIGGDPEDALPLAASLGFAGVEFSVDARSPAGNVLADESGWELLKRQSAETGVAVCSLCIGALGGMLTGDDAARAQGVRVAENTIAAAAELDAGLILCAMDAPPEQPYEESFSRWVDGFSEFMPAAERAGVVMAPESVGRTHPQSVERFRRLVAAIDSPQIGVYFDVGNAHTQGFDPAADLRALGGLVSQIHTKEPDQIPLMGTGPLDWDAIFAAIEAIGYDGWLVLETATGDDARASAVYNREFLEKRLGMA